MFSIPKTGMGQEVSEMAPDVAVLHPRGTQRRPPQPNGCLWGQRPALQTEFRPGTEQL